MSFFLSIILHLQNFQFEITAETPDKSNTVPTTDIPTDHKASVADILDTETSPVSERPLLDDTPSEKPSMKAVHPLDTRPSIDDVMVMGKNRATAISQDASGSSGPSELTVPAIVVRNCGSKRKARASHIG